MLIKMKKSKNQVSNRLFLFESLQNSNTVNSHPRRLEREGSTSTKRQPKGGFSRRRCRENKSVISTMYISKILMRLKAEDDSQHMSLKPLHSSNAIDPGPRHDDVNNHIIEPGSKSFTIL